MKRYDSYKDSGIDWIGQIPSHWETTKMNLVCSSITDFVASGSFADLRENVEYLDEPDYAMLVRTADLSNKNSKISKVYISQETYKFLSNSNLFGGEVILPNIGASIGDVYIVPKDLYTYMSLGPNSIMVKSKRNNKFLYYYFSSKPGRESLLSIGDATAQGKFNKTELRALKIINPPLSEQKEIADYLDRKCGEIDAAVAKVNKELELLDELKQSEISKAVTKGLNQNISFKTSSIDWIGEIPCHWKKCRFKNFIQSVSTPSTLDLKIGLENIESGTGKLIESDSEFEGNGILFKKNDIIYGKLRPYLRKVWQAEFEGNAVGDFFIFRNKCNSYPNYIKYLLLSDGFTKEADGSTIGAKMPRVSSEFILTLTYYLPPLSEQKEIADYLDKKCGKIDSLKEKLKQKKEKLQEIRQSLISEVVTGKRCIINS